MSVTTGRVARLLILFIAVSATAWSQGFQGGLRGAVKDANGVVPGVEVSITNEATNISRSAVTNESGEYNFSNVEPGTYTVKASLTGFKTIERQGIRVGT